MRSSWMLVSAGVACCLLCAILGGLLLPLLRRHVMDLPNSRSSHRKPIPRGGGVALMGTVVTAMLALALPLRPSLDVLLLLFVSLGLAVVGFIDDVRGLPPAPRLAAQVLGALVLAACFLATAAQAWTNSPALLVLAIAGVTVWLTGFTNAYNFMDGLNGIAGVTAIIAASWFTFLAVSLGLTGVAGLCASLAGASLGFLFWNFPRAKFFLGDVGSYAVGILLGGVATILVLRGANPLEVVAPLSIYLADTSITLAKRLRAHARVWVAHREHVYQQLTDGGVSPTLVTGGVGVLAVVACVATAMTQSTFITSLSLVVIASVYVVSPRIVAGTDHEASSSSRISR